MVIYYYYYYYLFIYYYLLFIIIYLGPPRPPPGTRCRGRSWRACRSAGYVTSAGSDTGQCPRYHNKTNSSIDVTDILTAERLIN